MILLDRVTKTYPGDEEPALDNVSLHIEPHEFVFLVGKSGAGKSTLIKMITKEEYPDSGKIVIGGIDLDYVKKRHIPHYRRRLGVVFQDYKLLPSRTVFENVAFALEIAGMSNREIQRTVPKVLDLVGLADKAHKFPAKLSGGERQRVSIARSVARQPKILIADEPTGNLDKLTRAEIIELLQKINDFGTTVLVTTHDENIVNNLSKRVITLKAGRIVDDQKNHGVYRLDSEPVDVEPQPTSRFVMPSSVLYGSYHTRDNSKTSTTRTSKLSTPTSNSASANKRAPRIASPDRTQSSIKVPHDNSHKKLTKPSDKNRSKPKANRATTPKQLSQDSANQWYNASRPLKAAPKLSDLSLSQTVKLKPAPSTLKKRPLSTPKVKQKQVV